MGLIGVILIIVGLIGFLLWQRRDKSKDTISGISTFRTIGGITLGTTDWSQVIESTIETIRAGLELAFQDGRTLGFVNMLTADYYRIAIVGRDGIYNGVAFFHGDGGDLGGDSIPDDCTIIVPWGFDEQAVRHEAEHIILFWNNKDLYDVTSRPGHLHPLLPKLIADMNATLSGAPDKPTGIYESGQ